jgi:hypothetical protein
MTTAFMDGIEAAKKNEGILSNPFTGFEADLWEAGYWFQLDQEERQAYD